MSVFNISIIHMDIDAHSSTLPTQQHKADAPFSYLGTPGMVLGGLNGCNRVCPRLSKLPYELLEM